MSESSKRPPSPCIVRRDGTVLDRETREVLGRVWHGWDGAWLHDRSERAFSYISRADAVASLRRTVRKEANHD